MTQLTIATVSICNKDYSNLTINSINTITGTSSVITRINYTVGSMGSGYKDTIILENPESIEYDYLLGQLFAITGLTQSI